MQNPYDPARAALAQQAIQANAAVQFQSIHQQLSAELTNASSVLETTTVFPGRWCTGIILTRDLGLDLESLWNGSSVICLERNACAGTELGGNAGAGNRMGVSGGRTITLK